MDLHLVSLLSAQGYDVAWLVGAQDAPLPYIRLQRVSGSDGLTLDGPTGSSEGRVQIDCYGRSFGEVKSMEAAVRGLLSGYRGGPITSARLQSIRDLADAAGGDVVQRISLDFWVRWHH